MNQIKVEGIKLYAYHGCLPEETKIGGNYIVAIHIETNFEKAAAKDDLTSTIDYVGVYNVVKKEMATPSKLIEHVANRIMRALFLRFKGIIHLQVEVTKLNPPMNGEVERVSVVCKE